MQLLGKRSEENNGVDLLGIIEEEVPKMTDHGLPFAAHGLEPGLCQSWRSAVPRH